MECGTPPPKTSNQFEATLLRIQSAPSMQLHFVGFRNIMGITDERVGSQYKIKLS